MSAHKDRNLGMDKDYKNNYLQSFRNNVWYLQWSLSNIYDIMGYLQIVN